jgi:hypothetical protein
MTTRLNQQGQPFQVDALGSAYLNYLHTRLALAEDLVQSIAKLNPQCLTLGPGTMANLLEQAQRFSASKYSVAIKE